MPISESTSPDLKQIDENSTRANDQEQSSRGPQNPLTSPIYHPMPDSPVKTSPLISTPRIAHIDTTPGALQRVPTEILPSPPLSPEQPSPEALLKKHAIKVRDFAYESILPPVRVVKRVPRPMPPGPRPLKRSRECEDEEEEEEWRKSVEARRVANQARRSDSFIAKAADLQRKPTEPVFYGSYLPPMRALGFADLSKWSPSPAVGGLKRSPPRFPFQLRHPPITPELSRRLVRTESPRPQSQSQSQPPLDPASQTDSDMGNDSQSPLLTPQGSMELSFIDSSALPESQVAPMMSESQNLIEDLLTPEMGFSETESQVDGICSADIPLRTSAMTRGDKHMNPLSLSPLRHRVFPPIIQPNRSRLRRSSHGSRSQSTPAGGDASMTKSTFPSVPRRSTRRFSTSPLRHGDIIPTQLGHKGKGKAPENDRTTESPRYFLRNHRAAAPSPNPPRTRSTQPNQEKAPSSRKTSPLTNPNNTRKLRSTMSRASPRVVVMSARSRAAAQAKSRKESKDSPSARPMYKPERGQRDEPIVIG